MVRRIFSVMVFWMSVVYISPLHSQHTYTKSDVRAMFPSDIKNLWINYLSGSIDNRYVVDMILGTDGTTCKGVYTMRNSKVSFFFEGEESNHELRLIEMNGDARTTGFIFGVYDGDKFRGQWMNSDKSMAKTMHLQFVNTYDTYYPAVCKQNQWQKIYSGRINDKNIRLHLIKDNLIFKCVNYEDTQKLKDITYGKGSRVEILKFNFENSVLSQKWVVIDTANLIKTDIIYLDDSGYEVTSSLKIENSLDFECFEYADYYSTLECVIPVSGNKKFNTWIENTFKSWINEKTKKLKNIKKDDIGTKDRWIQHADGWVDVDLFTNSFISGTIYLQTSWQPQTEKITFTFDLKAGNELRIQDIFDQKFNFKSFFDNYISLKKKEIIWKPNVIPWVNSQNFNYITLKDYGLSCRTEFNTIYGEKEIVIPYDELELYIKYKNLLKETGGI